MLNLKDISNFYFIGIGGIGMSAIAKYFNYNGKKVAGYDKTATMITDSLQALGIDVHFEDSLDLIDEGFMNSEKTLIIYTPAVPAEHSELRYFMTNNFHVLKRSQVLGEITKNTTCLAVAGTHGKTTTSALLGHILKVANANATSFLGGISENYNSNLILGGSEISVVEADEFDRSFLRLFPNIACITSMDADHLDIYNDVGQLESAFVEFSELVSDKLIIRKGLPIEGITYGIEEGADFNAENIRIANGVYTFDLKTPKESIQDIQINIPGRHNVLNAVAALAMANSIGIPLHVIAEALLSFKGIQRRFSYKIKTEHLVLIDDYAHHPTEINALVASVKEMYPSQKVLGIFQPHLFSRTRDFADDFAKSLSRFDELILLDIYPARELPIEGVNSKWLLDKIFMENKALSTKADLNDRILNSNAKVIVMFGAGDIGELVDKIKNKLEVEN
jgi:UDP-N-acetylmuramate--alanine ligase